MSEPLADFPKVIELPIEWGDMDALRHVNNTVYFRWFESARIAYFEAAGLLDSLERTGIGPILASTECRFRIPLAYPDSVGVGARVATIGGDRFVMDYLVVGRASGKVAAHGSGLIVSFDYNDGAKAPLPDGVRARILELEASVGHRPAPMAAPEPAER